jgi:hypothetical protein
MRLDPKCLQFVGIPVMLALIASAYAVPGRSAENEARLLVSENAYNPIPSPDGRFIAYVATGWGRRFPNEIAFSGGRSVLVSDVELMDPFGKVLTRYFARRNFLAGWTPDSKAVVCYRDWRYSLVAISGQILEAGEIPETPAGRYERVAFLSDIRRVAWLEPDPAPNQIGAFLRTATERLFHLDHKGMLAPSPDGRYLAVVSSPGEALWVYDRVLLHWAHLGSVAIHPAEDWGYIMPSWDPWFADSSRLVFFSGSNLIVSSPDGEIKQILLKTDQPAGLAVPSPNGESVSYVTFKSRAMKNRPDLKFWADTVVWVTPTVEGGIPRALTEADSATTSGLRWLGDDSLVFDRIDENVMAMHARIWKVSVR